MTKPRKLPGALPPDPCQAPVGPTYLSGEYESLKALWIFKDLHMPQPVLWNKVRQAIGKFRAVASLTVPVGKSSTFPIFSSNFDQIFLFFLKLYLFSSSFWPSGWASRPPGKALATPLGKFKKCDLGSRFWSLYQPRDQLTSSTSLVHIPDRWDQKNRLSQKKEKKKKKERKKEKKKKEKENKNKNK